MSELVLTLPQTGTIVVIVLLVLLAMWMLAFEAWWPGEVSRGLLGFATSRGDRFWIGMFGAILVLLAWIALVDTALLIPLLLGAVWFGAVLRWG